MKNFLLIAIVICLFSCGKEGANKSDSADTTVHLAGFVATSTGSAIASYWKNGVYTDLLQDSTYSDVTSLFVDGSTVLIGGWKVGTNSAPVLIWENGKETIVNGAFGSPILVASHNNNVFGVWFDLSSGWVFNKNGTSMPMVDTAYSFFPTAIGLLGDDIYIAGCGEGHDSSLNDSIYYRYQHAQFWKNGELIFRESEPSYVSSVCVHQSDVYMAGLLYQYTSPKSVACYWKNGQRVNLTGQSSDVFATSIFVTDKNVYTAGMLNDQAVYWKDGTLVSLTTEGSNSMANSIFVQGNNVHVAGYEHGRPAYWKNGVKQNISTQNKFGQIRFVVVGSSN